MKALTNNLHISGEDSNNLETFTFSVPSLDVDKSIKLITPDNFDGIPNPQLDENGNMVDSGSGYANNTNYEYDWNLDYGCYTFNIYDSYGDGVEASIWGAYEDGYVSLNDQSNGVMWYGVAYGYGESIAFEVIPGLDIVEDRDNEVNVYPNPSTDFTNVNLYLANNENITIKLYNSLGQIVKTDNKGLMSSGNHNIKINLDNLVEGLYFIELQIGNSIELQPINIVK